ncbi:MAG: cytosolic protein [Muribaculaceae bacterium]|nr:cytosolic protein [Muribaculaceae bacterium]
MEDLLHLVQRYVADNIHTFHEARLNKLNTLQLEKLLKKKNPYLYRAKNLNTPQDIVEALASAFMISAEETMFGDWLEQLAIFVAHKVYGGYKSTSEGIDLEMDKDGIHYVISVKSGPNWSNSSSMKKLLDNFNRAKRVYRTSGNRLPCEAVEGCCYGSDNRPNKASHAKLCGERFWSFISGSDTLYCDIVEPIGTDARKHNEDYERQYAMMVTRFTKDFANGYCRSDGSIDWDKIVMLNSGTRGKSNARSED